MLLNFFGYDAKNFVLEKVFFTKLFEELEEKVI